MRAEQQYIDLFRAYEEEIGRFFDAEFNARRKQAFESFLQKGFPAYQEENYQYTDLSAWLQPDYGLNIKQLKFEMNPYQVFRCDVPNLETNLRFMVNDQSYKDEEYMREHHISEGVFSGSMNEFATLYPDIFRKYYGKLAAGDPLADFNTMFLQGGYVLYIPKNTLLETPLQLIQVLTGGLDMLVNRRMLIIAEEGAQGKLLVCDHTSDETNNYLVNQVCEIYVHESASFDFYELEENSKKTKRINSVFMEQQAHSNLVVNTMTLMNGHTRNNYTLNLAGEHAEAQLSGMAILDGEKQVDNYTCIHHNVPNCHSEELFKYVLDEQSVGAFSGRIVVAQDAQKTRAYQNNRNLCVSPDCRMYSKPQLEIYADDVKCSHGMTTGQLDDNALFYMRSRGIGEDEARMLLKFAFTDDILENIRIDILKDRLKRLVEKRFRGELTSCRNCGDNCKNS